MKNIKNLIIYSLIGVGGGLVVSRVLKTHNGTNTSRFRNAVQNQKVKSKALLLNIIKSTDLSDNEIQQILPRIDSFVKHLNERQVIVLDKVYDKIQKQKLKYSDILKNIKDFDQKEIDSFQQSVELINTKLLSDKIKIINNQLKTYKANISIYTYQINDKRGLESLGKIDKDNTFKGAEKWIWIKSNVGDYELDKQIKVIQLENGSYIYYAGIKEL